MSKHSTATCYIHKFQNTTENNDILVHWYKFPNHDQVKLFVLSKSAKTILLSM